MAALRTEIAALFPPCVRGAELSAPEEAEPLFPEEQASIARAVDKRRLEFALGRTAARGALAALGVPPGPLPANEDRSVRWPDAAWGSITHADGLCAAVAAPRSELRGLGIDAEVKGRVEPRLWRMIATEREQAVLSALDSEAERREAATLLFSAKEAFYKAQYCVSQSWVGFHDAEVELQAGGLFRLRLIKAVAPSSRSRADPRASIFAAGTCFEGRYAVLERHVVTGLAIASR
jgi:4'-phosphopantetheinyl transferase EntD